MKKINPKENRHKTPRITWLGNSLHPRATTNKFHYNKFGIIQIGVKALSQTQIPNTPKQLFLTNTKTKNQRFKIPNMNIKYELYTNQRRATNQSHKSNPKVATHQKRANHQTVEPKPSSNKPLSLFQVATHKYQITKQERVFFTHTLISFSLFFRSSTMLLQET